MLMELQLENPYFDQLHLNVVGGWVMFIEHICLMKGVVNGATSIVTSFHLKMIV